MLDGLPLDPHTVLGVARGASAEAIRDAYHQKSRKHHPDLGGDDWAFRIVVRAYEILSASPAPAPLHAPPEPADTGRVRPGAHDKDVDPARLVHVEVLWMRYEVDDMLALLSERPGDRHLSGTLQITWPDTSLADRAATLPLADRILRALNAAFDELRAKTGPRSARSHIEGCRFEAMLGYPSGAAASAAFKVFHVGLKARGLGAKQWTRDVMVPRDEAQGA